MKRFAPLCLLFALICVIITPLFAATKGSSPSISSPNKSPVGSIATTITTITGIAISPLLGTGAYGAYKWIRASEAERPHLPWYAQWTFFVPALLLVLACACKDSLGAILPPGWKKPLDMLETLENKVSGLVAAGVVIPLSLDSLSGLITHTDSVSTNTLNTTGLAMMHLASVDFSWLFNVLTIPLGLAVYGIVWMTSHAINVLILLSPWGAIDAALKSFRTAMLGLLTATAALNPTYALILSLVIIVFSYFVAGWSFRLMIFGTAFCWDFFTMRKHRFRVDPVSNKLFSGAHLKRVPVRSFGYLVNEPENGLIRFVHRPWLVFRPRTINVTMNRPYIGKGLFFSSVRDTDDKKDITLFLLPPRYRGHEEKLAQIYKLEGGVRDAGLLKAWSSLRELFGGSATKAQVV